MGNTVWIYAQIKKYGVDKRYLCRWYSDPREGIKTSLERVCLKEREPRIKPWGCPSYCSLKEKDRLMKEQSFWRRKRKGMQHCNNNKKICSRERGRVKRGWGGQRSSSSVAAPVRALWMAVRTEFKDFPGGPVVKTLSSHCRAQGFNPCSRNKAPTCCVEWPKKKK